MGSKGTVTDSVVPAARLPSSHCSIYHCAGEGLPWAFHLVCSVGASFDPAFPDYQKAGGRDEANPSAIKGLICLSLLDATFSLALAV